MATNIALLEDGRDPSSPARRDNVLDVVSFIARFGMAAVWLFSGFTKTGEIMTTTQSIQAYEIFTPEVSFFLAHLMGPLELAGGAFLALGLFLKPASWVANVVLVLFIVGISQAWLRGLEINCGCFGPGGDTTNYPLEYAWTIIRDIVFIFLTSWTIYRPFKRWALHP